MKNEHTLMMSVLFESSPHELLNHSRNVICEGTCLWHPEKLDSYVFNLTDQQSTIQRRPALDPETRFYEDRRTNEVIFLRVHCTDTHEREARVPEAYLSDNRYGEANGICGLYTRTLYLSYEIGGT